VISIVRAPLLVVALASVEEELVDVEELVAAAVSPRASAEVDGPFWPQPARRVAERRDKESTRIFMIGETVAHAGAARKSHPVFAAAARAWGGRGSACVGTRGPRPSGRMPLSPPSENSDYFSGVFPMRPGISKPIGRTNICTYFSRTENGVVRA